MTEAGPRTTGTVLQAGSEICTILLDDGSTTRATLRGRIKRDASTGDRVIAGDRVTVERQSSGDYTIERVEPRRSQLVRRAPGSSRAKPKVIIANPDQVLVVMAAAHPEPRLGMLDRLLVLAEANGLAASIVVNKMDLVDEADVTARFAPYVAAGYPLILTSVPQARGLDQLREAVCGRSSVLTGPSGVGKSSLLNALEPGLGLRVGHVSEAVRKGRHTTVAAQLIPLACGGFLADTPGLREVGLWGIEEGTLDTLFPEFRPFLGDCRFRHSCTHTHEPDCAVRQAVETGEVSRERYDSYVRMLGGDELGVQRD